jgi:hypothetical protein
VLPSSHRASMRERFPVVVHTLDVLS